MHPLDRPIWNALTTLQAHFAQAQDGAVRFDPAVTALAACVAPTPAAFAGLAALLGDGEVAGLLFDDEPEHLPGLVRSAVAPLVQMIHVDRAALAAVAPPPAYAPLGPADVAEMIDLAERTRPGPFGPRTAELGGFLGVRDGGALVAMAGERMRVDGFTEVSAVCTDPAATGRGLAGSLVAEASRRICATGAVPFLHVRAENQRAIALYQRLGFKERRRFCYVIVRRDAEAGV